MNIKDFKWTEKRFGTTFANILKKLGGLSKDSTDGSLEYKDEQGNVTKLVTDSNFSSLLAKNGLIEVKQQELKDKRDNGELIPGSLYRITDYNCTTTQENTQSAGHQFDIVLLALSENKLAEEGWAMMHDNIYDVTFADGVTKKCYLYEIPTNLGYYNVVSVDTLLGIQEADADPNDGELLINEETKTVTTSVYASTDLMAGPLTYNYFQNSNLSAWKVWYCLDNDTARFAWADDSVDEDVAASFLCWSGIVDNQRTEELKPYYIFYRNTENDRTINGIDFYSWCNIDGEIWRYTTTDTPTISSKVYGGGGTEYNFGIDEVYPPHEGTNLPNGRGVIYRLIDEWNNDVPYDFKNIQFLRKLDGGQIDVQGTDIYCYTFTLYDLGNAEYKDASIFAIEYVNDEGGINPCYNNSINSTSAYNSPINYNNKYSYALPYITFLSSVESGSLSWGSFDNKLFGAYNSTFEGNCAVNIVLGGGAAYTDLYESFVSGGQRASMESI